MSTNKYYVGLLLVERWVVSHSKILWNVKSFSFWCAVVDVVSSEFISECWIVEVGTKPMIAQWSWSCSNLRSSTLSHPKVLMTIVDARSFINACINASDVLSCKFRINVSVVAIKSWSCWITSIDSINHPISQLYTNFKAQSRTKTEPKQKHSIVISNLPDFS